MRISSPTGKAGTPREPLKGVCLLRKVLGLGVCTGIRLCRGGQPESTSGLCWASLHCNPRIVEI